MITKNNESHYLFFSNMNTTGGYVGNSIFAIRELDTYEFTQNCLMNKTNKTIILSKTPSLVVNFSSNFWIRIYTSGCYYFNESNWYSDGMEIAEDSDLFFAHCYSTHLTEFAGGWVVLPTPIDFNYVFANASFERNLTIYMTVIIVAAAYLSLLCYTRYMDYRDSKKIGFGIVADNFIGDNYFYKVTTYTGSRKGAGTKAKVRKLSSIKNDRL